MQRRAAERNLHSGIIAKSEVYMDEQLDVSLLLAIEAESRIDTPRARTQLLRTIHKAPYLISFLHGHTQGSIGLIFSPDGKTLASLGSELVLWDAKTRQPLRPPVISYVDLSVALAVGEPALRSFRGGGKTVL
jgi:hypothetical protein